MPDRLDAFGVEPQYLDHLLPVWEALPPEYRGTLYDRRPDGRGPIMVASYKEYVLSPRRPVVFVEHGAGQSYNGRHPAYSGGPRRDRSILFLCPGEEVARRNRATYPSILSVAVGPPKLDPWIGKPSPGTGIIALAFHWNAHVAPEGRSALEHYRKALPELARSFHVIGHGHPRAAPTLRKVYRQAGIEYVPSFAEVLDRADLLVCDNSSVLYEFAALDRPVVVLDAPWYRRNVEHGLRFWEHADVGVRVQSPNQLGEAVGPALSDPDEVAERRRRICRAVYGELDGRSSERAAAAVVEVLRSRGSAAGLVGSPTGRPRVVPEPALGN